MTQYDLGKVVADDGVGIESIEKTNSSGLVDTYTVTFTDESTTTFNVTNGADGSDGYNAASNTATKTVTYSKRPTYLAMKVDKSSITIGESITITYGFGTSDWQANHYWSTLNGYTLKVYDGNTLLKTFTTPTSTAGININSTVTVTPTSSAGTHNIRLVFEGNNNYNSSNISANITVNKQNTTINGLKIYDADYNIRTTANIGDELNIVAQVSIGECPIRIDIYDNYGGSTVINTTSYVSGYIDVYWVPDYPAGPYTIKVSFAGNSNYNPTEQYAYITIKA